MYRLIYVRGLRGVLLYASYDEFIRVQGSHMKVGQDGRVYWCHSNVLVGWLAWEGD